MSTLPRAFLTAALVVALGSSAWAIKDPETGQKFPDSIKCGGKPAKAAGVGVREATLGVDVYAVVVYVDDSFKGKSVRWSNGCVKIRARFVRDVDADKVMGAWNKSFKRAKLSASDPKVKKFLSVIKGEMKKGKEMTFETKGGRVVHKFMGKSVTITGAPKLAKAIKATYLSGGSPTPELIKSVKKRGVAKP